MREWKLAGAFDSGYIRGLTSDYKKELVFHQLELTGHAEQLESDYRLCREEFGMELFRDGAWLARSFPEVDRFEWGYLDQLAEASRGQIHLSLCHYEWPAWATEEQIWDGSVIEPMGRFAYAVAERYRGRFAGYIPVVESGYWTAMVTDWARWWPAGGQKRSWWNLYRVVGRMLVTMAREIKRADPGAEIGLSEPWAWHPHLSLDDQGRPFNTLLGREDLIAVRETGTDEWGGHPSLLQIVGLNFYNNWGADHGWPLSRLLLEARRQYPDQRLFIGETGNCHFSDCHTVSNWLELLDEQVNSANRDGAAVEVITWAPILTLGDFDWGHPAPGAIVTWEAHDPKRRRHWSREVARQVRGYTQTTQEKPCLTP